MAEKVKIVFWQGLETNRTGVTPDAGVPLYTTDEKKLYMGDGSTAGGTLIGPGTGSVAGSNTEIQYNDTGAFGASSKFTWDDTNEVLTLESADAGTTAEPSLILFRNSASPANNDFMGQLQYRGKNSGAGNIDYAEIRGQIIQNFATDEDGCLSFWVYVQGTKAEVFRVLSDNGVKSAIGVSPPANPDGILHVHNSSAGAVTANQSQGNTLIVESSGDTGISLLSPNAFGGHIFFGSPAISVGASIVWDHDSDLFSLGTGKAGAKIQFTHGAGVDGIQIESDGTLSSVNATYETLITADDDFVTKKWIDDQGFGSASAAGASTQIQYNTSNAFDASAKFTWTNTTGSEALYIASDDAGAAVGPILTLDRNSATSAAGDILGGIKFIGETESAGGSHPYAQISAQILDPTNGSEDGGLNFALGQSGGATPTNVLRLLSDAGISKAAVGSSIPATPDGTFHIHQNTAGAVTAQSGGNILVLEGSDDTGMSILSPNASNGNLYFGNPANNIGAQIKWGYTLGTLKIGTNKVGGKIIFAHGADSLGIQIESDGTLSTVNATYETLVTADDDIPNKKYVDDLVTGLQTLYIPAGAMIPTATNGCSALASSETTAGRPDINYLAFADGSDTSCQFNVAMPKKWNEGTITFEVFWTGLVAGAGTVEWDLQGVSVANDGTLDVVYGTAVTVTDTFLVAEDAHRSPTSGAVTISGAAVDTITYFRLIRTGTTDTRAAPANLLGVKLFYTIDNGSDD